MFSLIYFFDVLMTNYSEDKTRNKKLRGQNHKHKLVNLSHTDPREA